MKDEKKISEGVPAEPGLLLRPPGGEGRASEMLTAKRPDVKIVGDELHPLAKVKDFAPYVAKIQASGADTVITGNWGSDLQLLVKAAKDANLKADFYTYYAGVVGTPPALGDSGVERVKVVSYWSGQLRIARGPDATSTRYKKKYGATNDPYTGSMHIAVELLAQAMTKAKSHGSGEGREGDGGHDVRRPVRRRRDARHRPPADPAALRRDLREGRRQVRATRRDGTTDYAFRQDARFEGAGDGAAHDLQDAAPVVSGLGARPHLTPERSDLRAAAVHAVVGAHAHLQHDGRAQLRARELLHAGRVLRLRRSARRWGSGRRWSSRRSLVGAIGALVERYGLRRAHASGHVSELLFTFGLAFLIEEVVRLVWGKTPVPYKVPAVARRAALHALLDHVPRLQGLHDAGVGGRCWLALYAALTRTRVGLVIRAALTRPDMVEALGHNVPRVFMLVFGGGTRARGARGRDRRQCVRDRARDGGVAGHASCSWWSWSAGWDRSPARSSRRSSSASCRRSRWRWTTRSYGVSVSRVAPVLPYLIMVADPDRAAPGAAGDARIVSRALAGLWGVYAALLLAAPLVVPQRLRAVAALPDGHRRRVRALVQHAARADGAALVRPRGVLRAGRALHDPRAEPRTAGGGFR